MAVFIKYHYTFLGVCEIQHNRPFGSSSFIPIKLFSQRRPVPAEAAYAKLAAQFVLNSSRADGVVVRWEGPGTLAKLSLANETLMFAFFLEH